MIFLLCVLCLQFEFEVIIFKDFCVFFIYISLKLMLHAECIWAFTRIHDDLSVKNSEAFISLDFISWLQSLYMLHNIYIT